MIRLRVLYIFMLFVTAISFTSVVFSQEPNGDISEFMQLSTEGKVKITQPEALHNRLKYQEIHKEDTKGETSTSVGYRIQVFADSNQRTAKNQAQTRERNIATKFPELKVYLLFKSPSWRVRVGDFKTRSEAEQVMQDIKTEFPDYANEMMVVVDKINLLGK